ncbi:MAG: MFS transporter [Terrimicrobiaceae bacterium]
MPVTSPSKTHSVGTLTYTKPALMILFFWLLWGDVCYTLMESVTAPIMLKRFERLGAMNWEIALILSTIPTTVYSILNPVISFKSDRFRSRWGRRIPFILVTLPFLVLALVGLAFGERLGIWLHDALNLSGVSQNQATLWTLGVLLVTFTFFNTFVTSTFWYLFNDVVPERLLARFMSWFRVLATLTAAFYSICIFPYSGTHSTEIFLGAALLYLVGFSLMCLNVKEGRYPPPAPYVGGRTGPVAMVKTYVKECHSHRIYWYLWLCTFISQIGAGVALFDLYLKQSIGLDMAQIGIIAGTVSIVVSVLVIGVGWLADRYHPIRVLLAAQALGWIFVTPASMTWIFWHPGPAATWTFHLSALQHVPFLGQFAIFQIQQVFLISLLIYVGLAAPVVALATMWDPVMLMRIFPRANLGQFCSTNAVWRSVGGMIGALLAGGFLDLITPWVGKECRYFYCPVWSVCFAVPSTFFFLKFYRSWKRHGGDRAYVAPMLETAAHLPPVPGTTVLQSNQL